MTMLRFARRLDSVLPSATIAVKEEADRLKRAGIDVIDFGPGEPDFNTPEHIKEAARAAIARNLSHYLPTLGLLELREAIAADYRRRHGTDYTAAEVIVSCGGKNALFAAAMALFDQGDEVIIPAPYWVSFPDQIRLAGGIPVILETTEEEGFIPRARDAERLLTPATRGVILCSPSNPTGAAIPEDEIARWADLALSRDLYLIFDECYERFLYDGRTHASMARHAARLRDRLVLAATFSKSYAMTGYRIGFALADRRIVSAMATVQSHDSTHAASIVQAAALEAVRGPQDEMARMVSEYDRRRAIMVNGLRSIPGVTCLMPAGAFYAFPGVAGLYGRLGVGHSLGVAKALLTKARVAVVPGEAFGVGGYLRFSYALAAETIETGIARLREALSP
jgi:aspartate aminotransferase